MKWSTLSSIVFAAASLVFVSESHAQMGRGSLSAPASYSAPRHEVVTYQTDSGLYSGKYSKNGDSGTDLSLNIGYLRTWDSHIQFGGEGGLYMISKARSGTNGSETVIQAVGLAVYNVSSHFNDSFFFKGGVGLYALPKDNASGYENKLGFFVGGGKRFPLFQNVSYSPEVRLLKRGDIDLALQLQIINFSLIW